MMVMVLSGYLSCELVIAVELHRVKLLSRRQLLKMMMIWCGAHWPNNESVNYYSGDGEDEVAETNLWSFKLKNDLNKVPVILLPTHPPSI